MTKTKLVEELKEYFTSKGKIMSYNEYVLQEDAPIGAQIIRRAIGPWSRLERMLGEINPVAAEVIPELEVAPTVKVAPVTKPVGKK